MKMKKLHWQIPFGIGLLILSAVLYLINYGIFHDAHHIFVFLTEDLAFIPIEVLVVTLIIDKVIEKREKEHIIEKLNMVIGIFFTEIGIEMLKDCTKLASNLDEIKNYLIIKENWKDKDFNKTLKILKNYDYSIEIHKADLEELKTCLVCKRQFLIRLLENPNLLEHETFTDLLSAVFHLEEELLARDLSKLSKEDEKHLEKDIERVYEYIVFEWFQYMIHIKNTYPYLFTAALKNNPFHN
jgi:hypothetical protein